MQLALTTAINIKYELLPDAPRSCMPRPVDIKQSIFALATRINFSLAYNNIMKVPTGIRLLSFPELALNNDSTQQLNAYIVGTCYASETLATNGIEILGPKIIEAPTEINIIMQNHSKTVFKAEAGDIISLLAFNIKPFINLSIDTVTQNIPPELRKQYDYSLD